MSQTETDLVSGKQAVASSKRRGCKTPTIVIEGLKSVEAQRETRDGEVGTGGGTRVTKKDLLKKKKKEMKKGKGGNTKPGQNLESPSLPQPAKQKK